jgi:hypothetical protein
MLPEEARRARSEDAERRTVQEAFVGGLDDSREHAGHRCWEIGSHED